jgi:hypothetical protein
MWRGTHIETNGRALSHPPPGVWTRALPGRRVARHRRTTEARDVDAASQSRATRTGSLKIDYG